MPWSSAARSPSVLPLALLLLPLAQVVLRRTRRGARRRAVGVEVLLGDGGHAAVVAHPDHVEALRCASVHPVPALELGRHALDRALDPERLAAADAAERLLLLEHARARGGGAEVDLRHQRD